MFSFTLKKKGKVFVGLSGGVDSAVSAALLKRQGYEVTGVFIRIALSGYPCPAAQDRIEAMRVAAHLKIPFIEIDLSKEYEKRVFEFSIKEFERGRTPNPDALCNREIKFGVFYDFAKAHGADFVATGHYAQLVRDGRAQLLAGADDTKDQSYFLWVVPETHLRDTLFPVGGMKKTNVRALARTFGLPNSARRDSQGLCFLGDISLEDMLMQETNPVPGEVLSESGEVLGVHKGAQLYTLGQRHGFDLNNRESDVPAHFVVAKNIETNTITVSPNRFPQGVKKTILTLTETNWIGEVKPGEYMARFRYRQKRIPATLTLNKNECLVELHEPHYVPEGQSLVLYLGERCVGGGIINTATLSA
jgi:tRNA-specific 2-thiouridylase